MRNVISKCKTICQVDTVFVVAAALVVVVVVALVVVDVAAVVAVAVAAVAQAKKVFS